MFISLRCCRRVCVVLTFGVIANVGVAWVLNELQGIGPDSLDDAIFGGEAGPEYPAVWQSIAPHGCAATAADGMIQAHRVGYLAFTLSAEHDNSEPLQGCPDEIWEQEFQEFLDHAYVARIGWPAYALTACYISHRDLANEGPWIDRRNTFLQLRTPAEPSDDPFWLPIVPLWPGFATNTLLYASALWMLLFAPAALRRRLRQRLGQCANCGYPRGAAALCTECGAALARRCP